MSLLKAAEFGSLAWARASSGASYFLSAPVNYLPDYADRALASVLMCALGPRPKLKELEKCAYGFVAMDGAVQERFNACLTKRARKLAARRGHVDVVEWIIPQAAALEPLLHLCTGGGPISEVFDSERPLAQALEIMAVASSVRSAVQAAGVMVVQDLPALYRDVRRVFQDIVKQYEAWQPALPLRNFCDVTHLAVPELLFYGPRFSEAPKFHLKGDRFMACQSIPNGGLLAMVPVDAVLTSDGCSSPFRCGLPTNCLVLNESCAPSYTKLTCFLEVENFCEGAFGRRAALLGDYNHETVKLVKAAAKGAEAFELMLCAGIWPCIRATKRIVAGQVLAHLGDKKPDVPVQPKEPTGGLQPTQLSQESRPTRTTEKLKPTQESQPSQPMSPMQKSQEPTEPTPQVAPELDPLAIAVTAANALAREQRQQRRRGGRMSCAPGERKDVPPTENVAPEKPRKPKAKPATSKQREQAANATAEFLRETREVRLRPEDSLQHLEFMRIEEDLKAALTQERRSKPKPKKKKPTLSRAVVHQLLCKE